MDIATGGKSIVMLIRELTESQSTSRVYDYCDVFKHNPHILSGYIGAAEGEGSGWAFHNSWGNLMVTTAVGQSVADLIKFAYHLKSEPLDKVAPYAAAFVKRDDTRWRHIFSGAQLRPLVKAGVSPEYASTLLFRGTEPPQRQDAFRGQLDRKRSAALIGSRLANEKNSIVEMWKAAVPIEYAETLLP